MHGQRRGRRPRLHQVGGGHLAAGTYDGGGGGFTSYDYTQPWYQAGVVPSALALRNAALFGDIPLRVEPDISMDADPSTGFLIGLHETFPNGTVEVRRRPDTAGPAWPRRFWPGVIADADQAAELAVGFINPAIYKLDSTPGAIDDIRPGGKQAQIRVDHAFTYVPGAKGYIQSFRELTYEGVITYCDATGNCATRPNTLTTAKGYDSMTGLGATGPNFVSDLAKP